MTTSMAKTLDLGEGADKFHPDAVKKYREFISQLQSAVDLTEITYEDIRAFLDDSNYQNFSDIYEKLVKYLAENRLSKNFTAKDYTSSFPWTYGFESLLKRASEQKIYQKKLKEAQADAQFQSYLDLRQRDREREEAKVEHKDFVDKLEHSITSFKASLAKSKEPQFNDCPDWLQSYHPGLWRNLPFPPKNWTTARMIINIAAHKLSLMEALRDHVDVKLTYGAWYVPSVKYEVIAPPPSPHSKGHPAKPGTGVPCLRWQMATYIRTTAEFWHTDGIIIDKRYDYTWEIQCIRENLGKLYGGPEFWQYQSAFITPVSLLALLAWGKAELPSVEVVRRNAPWTTYKIEGFRDEVTLHDDFIRFIRDMVKKTPLDKSLLSRGMCDTETAGLVKAKLEKLKEPEALAAVLGIANGPESKTGDDYSDVVYRLTHQMGYKDAEAKAAAEFACEKYPNGTVLEKIKIALQSLGQ